jgi:hypothetical protein
MWMKSQEHCNYMSLRAGIGEISLSELEAYNPNLCPKTFFVKPHRLRGIYQIVHGSRFNFKPVIPEIIFQVKDSYELSTLYHEPEPSFPCDAVTGIKGTTFEELVAILLKANRNATLDTVFYISFLEHYNPKI